MRNILKYLILVIVAAVFGHADFSAFSDLGTTTEDNSIQSALYETCIWASDSELCLPRQESFTNSIRVQSTARRTNCVQRNSLEFTKSGKIINAGQQYFIQRKSIIIHSSLIEPAQKLLYLGKLII